MPGIVALILALATPIAIAVLFAAEAMGFRFG